MLNPLKTNKNKTVQNKFKGVRTDASPSGLTHSWSLVCSRRPQHFPFKPGYITFHWKNVLSYSRCRCTNTLDKNTQQVTNNTVDQWWRCCRASFSDLQRHERLIRNTDGSKTALTSTSVTHHGDLAGLFASSNPQLVDGRLGDICSLLGFVQVVLDFAETYGTAAHLLLLVDKKTIPFK